MERYEKKLDNLAEQAINGLFGLSGDIRKAKEKMLEMTDGLLDSLREVTVGLRGVQQQITDSMDDLIDKCGDNAQDIQTKRIQARRDFLCRNPNTFVSVDDEDEDKGEGEEDEEDEEYEALSCCMQEGRHVLNGFDEVARMIGSGHTPAVGRKVCTMLDERTAVMWRVIGLCEYHVESEGVWRRGVVVQACEAIDHYEFSRPSKTHPYGCNDYNESAVAGYLNAYVYNLPPESQRVIVPREIDGMKHMLWLLSAEEAGFGDKRLAYAYYACENQEEAGRRRCLTDQDGDPCYWWLRTPSSGLANSVRNVTTGGSLYINDATYALGVAPACIIGIARSSAPLGAGKEGT